MSIIIIIHIILVIFRIRSDTREIGKALLGLVHCPGGNGGGGDPPLLFLNGAYLIPKT